MESQLDTGLVSVLVALLVPWADVLAVSMAPESVSLLAAPLALPMVPESVSLLAAPLALPMDPESGCSSVSLLAAPLALPMDTPSTPLMWYYPSNSAQVAPSCLM